MLTYWWEGEEMRLAHQHSREETVTVATVAGGRHTRRSSGGSYGSMRRPASMSCAWGRRTVRWARTTVRWAVAQHNCRGKPAATYSLERGRRRRPARQFRRRWTRSTWRRTATTGEDGGGVRKSDARRRLVILSCAWRMMLRQMADRWKDGADRWARCRPQRHWLVGHIAIVF
jgi:hypothetical protein